MIFLHAKRDLFPTPTTLLMKGSFPPPSRPGKKGSKSRQHDGLFLFWPQYDVSTTSIINCGKFIVG